MVEYQAEFNAVTRRARARFETRDWQGSQDDATARLDLYGEVLERVAAALLQLLGRSFTSVPLWRAIRREFRARIAGGRNVELSETFFSSVELSAAMSEREGPGRGFQAVETPPAGGDPGDETYQRYLPRGDTRRLIRDVLRDSGLSRGFEDLERDVGLVAREIDRRLEDEWGGRRMDTVELIRPVFYRRKGAYIVGRIRSRDRLLPLVLPLHNEPGGIVADAVLTDEDEVSILFSFTRSYFHVDADSPREVILFLKSIMPLKPVNELYISLGFNLHGKTELYREVHRHLASSGDRFQAAEGDRGMVMLVFTLPSYDVVFKVIRDRFDYPKTATRREVMDRYKLVFKHDRVGRLVDAQQFDHLRFDKARFSPELLHELTRDAAESVTVAGHEVVFHQVYTERRVTPLNLYLADVGRERARRAVLDYGNAIKELAAANIFPGDFLLKNFGVTRHGRVVFYDYDELCLVTDCAFRDLPAARSYEEELEAEPWFTVGESDVFPEEFTRFLGLPGPLKQLFIEHHGDLLSADFWRGLQQRHRSGEILDFFPYPQQRRLR